MEKEKSVSRKTRGVASAPGSGRHLSVSGQRLRPVKGGCAEGQKNSGGQRAAEAALNPAGKEIGKAAGAQRPPICFVPPVSSLYGTENPATLKKPDGCKNGSPSLKLLATGVVTEQTAGAGGRGKNKNRIRMQIALVTHYEGFRRQLRLARGLRNTKKGRPGEGHPLF